MTKYSDKYYEYTKRFCIKNGIADIKEFTNFCNDNVKCLTEEDFKRVFIRYRNIVELNGGINSGE